MAIDYDSGTGLFDALGALAKTANDVRADRAAFRTRLATMAGTRGAADLGPIATVIGRRAEFEAATDRVLDALRAAATLEIIETMQAEAGASAGTLASAGAALAAAMAADSESIDVSAVTATVTPDAGNTGDADVFAAVIDGDGREIVEATDETIVLEATAAAAGGSTTWRATGETPADWRSPDTTGSGSLGEIRGAVPVSGGSYQAGASVLANGSFKSATANVPDQWELLVGTAGVDVVADADGVHTGEGSLELVGDGSTLPRLRQRLGDPAGTAPTLVPREVYLLAFRVKTGGLTPATGTLRLAVTDSSGTPLSGASVTFAAATAAGTWSTVATTFASPASIPSGLEVRLEATVALDATKSVLVDDVVLVRMVELYPGGPRVAVVRGETDAAVGDRYEIDVANPNGTATLLGAIDRLVGLRAAGVRLPVSTSGTLTDALLA